MEPANHIEARQWIPAGPRAEPLTWLMIPTSAAWQPGGIVRSTMIVFVGSGIGGALRHLVGFASLRLLGRAFPYGTLAINIVGSALMSLVVGFFAAFGSSNHELRLFLTTGLIGGFTTWSTFTLDTVTLWERGQPVAAAGYVLGTFIVSLVVIVVVLFVARRWA
jgi:CrcB protein